MEPYRDCSFLTKKKVEEIRPIYVPILTLVADYNAWRKSPNGLFTVASAYASICSSSIENNGVNLEWIWKLHCPERVRFFLWTLVQGKLNTNDVRKKKGLTSFDRCGLCNDYVEDADHVLRNCSFEIMVWRRVGIRPSHFAGLPLINWVKKNCLFLDRAVHGISWGTLFCSILWGMLWKSRCSRVMEGSTSYLVQVVAYDFSLGKDISAAWEKGRTSVLQAELERGN